MGVIWDSHLFRREGNRVEGGRFKSRNQEGWKDSKSTSSNFHVCIPGKSRLPGRNQILQMGEV